MKFGELARNCFFTGSLAGLTVSTTGCQRPSTVEVKSEVGKLDSFKLDGDRVLAKARPKEGVAQSLPTSDIIAVPHSFDATSYTPC